MHLIIYGETVKMKISFGYPEVLQVTGTTLIVCNHHVAGFIFCGLGLLGLALRFGIKVNEQEQQKKELENVLNSLGTVGNFVAKLVSNANNSSSNYKNDGLH